MEKTKRDFENLVEKLTTSFVGREREKKKLKEWITTHEEGFFFIHGKAGIGKSSFIARIIQELKKENVREKNWIIIEYFLRRGTTYATPTSMLKYLNQSLGKKFENKTEEGKNAAEMYDNLGKYLQFIKETNRKVIIFIDGLNETKEKEIIKYLIKDTYKNVVVIYGTRMTPEIKRFYNCLPAEYKEKEKLGAIESNDTRVLLNKYSLEENALERIYKKSKGNPLYIKLLSRSIDNGNIDITPKNFPLPQKIEGFYKLSLKNYRESGNSNVVLQGLYLFAAAKDVLTKKHLETILNISPSTAGKILRVLQDLLYKYSKGYQLFHETLREYLQKEAQYGIQEATEKILTYCRKWNEHNTPTIKEYPYKYYAEHLYELGKKQELYELIFNNTYQENQIAITARFEDSFNTLDLGLKATEHDAYKAAEIGVEILKLHLKTSTNLTEIERLINKGGKRNYKMALEKIFANPTRDKAILLFRVLRSALEKTKDKKLIDEILKTIDNYLPKGISTLDLSDIFPPQYLAYIIAKLPLQKQEIIWERVENTFRKNNILQEISFKLAKQGEHKKAKRLTEKISDAKAKDEALQQISRILIGKKEFDNAVSFAKKIENKQAKSNVLGEIAFALAKLGKVAKAISLIEKSVDSISKDQILNDISNSLSKLKETNKALSFVQKINDIEKKCETLSQIAGELAQEGNTNKAEEILNQAITIAKEAKDKHIITRSLYPAFAQIGKIDTAISLAEKSKDETDKTHILATIAQELAKRGEIDRALSLIKKTKAEGEFSVSFALKEISIQLAKQNKADEAISLIESIQIETLKNSTLMRISIELAKLGKIDEAYSLSQKVTSTSFPPQNIPAEICLELIREQKTDEAFSLLEKVRPLDKKIDALIEISKGLNREGNKTKAYEILTNAILIIEKLEELNETEGHDRIPVDILEIIKLEASEKATLQMATLGKIDNAIMFAEKIEETSYKNGILEKIAAEVARQGNFSQVERALKKTIETTGKFKSDKETSKGLQTTALALARSGRTDEALLLLKNISFYDALYVQKEIAIEIAKSGKLKCPKNTPYISSPSFGASSNTILVLSLKSTLLVTFEPFTKIRALSVV